jgi:hypothetical protein
MTLIHKKSDLKITDIFLYFFYVFLEQRVILFKFRLSNQKGCLMQSVFVYLTHGLEDTVTIKVKLSLCLTIRYQNKDKDSLRFNKRTALL